jgi:flagellar basal body rod protein FlgG
MVHKAYTEKKIRELPMINGTYSTQSALDSFSTSLAVISNNVANINTNGFKKSEVTLAESKNGGVEVSIRKMDTPGSLVSSDESSKSQTEETSNVDLAEEIVHTTLAHRGFEANLVTLKAHDELQGMILDIVG